MIPSADAADGAFREALLGLRRGDFSRLEPLFIGGAGDSASRPQIVQWHEQGRFADHPTELAEALTCACFNGRTPVAKYLLSHGVTVWSAINEPRPAHIAIVEALLAAGANVAEEVNFPTGHAALDDLLRRYGAT